MEERKYEYTDDEIEALEYYSSRKKQELAESFKVGYDYDTVNRFLRYVLGNGMRDNTISGAIPIHIGDVESFKKLLENPKNNTLSNQALETLAIIAYNEPITRLDVDEMRGVDSVYVMRRLLAKGLIKECGRSDKPGHPILYKTTDEFLDYFGLSSKEDLPKIDILEEANNEDKDLFKSTYKEQG